MPAARIVRGPAAGVMTALLLSALMSSVPPAHGAKAPRLPVRAPGLGLRTIPGTGPAVPGAQAVIPPISPDLAVEGIGISPFAGMEDPAAFLDPPATSEETTTPTPISLRPRWKHETPRSYGAVEPHPSAGPEAFFRVHTFGAVYAMSDPETMLWNRQSSSFFADWGAPQVPYIPVLFLGSVPAEPLAAISENMYAIGDVTGDGTEDVVIAHYVPVPSELKGTFVSVLDGRDGRTVWWKHYAGLVMHVVLSELDPSPGLEVVVTREPSATATGKVHALDVDGAAPDDELWTLDTGVSGDIFLHAAEVSADPPRIAASVTNKGYGSPAPLGRLMVVDGRTGDQVWTQNTTGWVRTFRADPSGDRFVVQEMRDPASDDPWSYSLTALSADDGRTLTSTTGAAVRDDALMIQLDVGDADGDGQTEWAASELGFSPETLAQTSTRVLLFESSADTPIRWTYEVPVDALETPFGLLIVRDPRPAVVVATFTGRRDQSRIILGDSLFALDGAAAGAATTLWRQEDTGVLPLWIRSTTSAGRPAALIGGAGGGGGVWSLADGTELDDVEVLAEPLDASATDVDGDGTTDLLVGGTSRVLFALDGEHLDPVIPRSIWTVPIRGSIREIQLADVEGDATPEVIVAASDRVAVVRLEDGKLLWVYRRPATRPFELVWTVGVGDLNRDGYADVVVPGERLVALDGTSGAVRWTWEPTARGLDPSRFSNVVVADANGDGAADVAAQYAVDAWGGPLADIVPRHVVGLVMIGGTAGMPLWEHRVVGPLNVPQLWRSVIVSESTAGPRFGFTYGDPPHLVPSTPPRLDSFPRPITDVYDGAGRLAWSTGQQAAGYEHMLTMPSPRGGDEVLEFNWYGINRGTPSGWVSTDTKSLFDADLATLLPGEDHLVVGGEDGASRKSVEVYPAAVAWGAGGDDPGSLASWDAFVAQAAEIDDLDNDGVDEIIALPFDFGAFVRIRLFEGTSIIPGDALRPKGVAILEAVGA